MKKKQKEFQLSENVKNKLQILLAQRQQVENQIQIFVAGVQAAYNIPDGYVLNTQTWKFILPEKEKNKS